MATSEPWWQNDPTIQALTRQVMAEIEEAAARPSRPKPDPDQPDPVVDEFYSGTCRRALAAARDGLAAARAAYDEAVLNARTAGYSWSEIGAVLGVSKQQLHRRFRGRS
ncbi:hypothetical protein [[Mycobacterium] burgundiense]|uniref:Helix-turn-helix domain-containing protein n=1 Tax=[Mycobacterium] burgundiense TaxID=3064286 RepID=A0ABN9MY56_9MYCO|nr:hypothetical protein [Mycolicibacterium sp. MU0053]CAJ1496758.1 hypothetical protein MU0053_000734 [Mycolicibacterium sp. MU0053]